jgi:arginine:ornithine antiporter/lysine permease
MPQQQPPSKISLSVYSLFTLTFGSMMGSGVFDIPQNIANRAGVVAVLLHWIIVAIGILAIGSSLIYISAKNKHITNGIYGYAKYGFGDFIGFNTAWGYMLSAVLGNASYLIYIFATLSNIFPIFGHNQMAGISFAALIAQSIIIWVIYFIIAAGIKQASIVNMVVTTMKVIALIVIIVLFIYAFHWNVFRINLSSLDLHLGSMQTQIKSTMLVTVWDFIGIEAACVYALYAKSMKDVVKATMWGIIVVLLIDFALSVLPFGILSTENIQHLTTPSTAMVIEHIIGNISANIVRITIVISVTGSLLAWQMLATNILYVAANDQNLPKIFNRLNKKQVPQVALLSSSILLQVFILCAHYGQALYISMIQIATSLILIPYLISTLYAVKLMCLTRQISYYDLLKGIVAVIYSIWLIYAGGLNYLVISSIMYVCGLAVYYQTRKSYHKPIFINKLEIITCSIICITAIVSIYLWVQGFINV